MSNTVDTSRIEAIAAQIKAACSPVLGVDRARLDAKEALNDAGDKATGTREAIMVALAHMSHAGGWTENETRAAAAKAASLSSNEKTSAIGTFIGETLRAMHPLSREHVPAIVALRDTLWADEAAGYALDKSAPTPLRKAFVRQYHMMTTMFKEATAGNLMLRPDQIIAYAEAHDPDMDPAKVLKAIKSLSEKVRGHYINFPLAELQEAIIALDNVTKKDLDNVPRTVPAMTTAPLAPIPTVVADRVIAAKFTTTTTEDNSGPAEGAVDVLDDILGDDNVDYSQAA